MKQKDITAVMKEVVAIDTDTETGKLANVISIHPKKWFLLTLSLPNKFSSSFSNLRDVLSYLSLRQNICIILLYLQSFTYT